MATRASTATAATAVVAAPKRQDTLSIYLTSPPCEVRLGGSHSLLEEEEALLKKKRRVCHVVSLFSLDPDYSFSYSFMMKIDLKNRKY